MIKPDEALVELIIILIDDPGLDERTRQRIEDLAQDIQDALHETLSN